MNFTALRILKCGIYARELSVGDSGDFTFCIKSRALRWKDLDRLSAEFKTKQIDFGAPKTNSFLPKKGFQITIRNPK